MGVYLGHTQPCLPCCSLGAFQPHSTPGATGDPLWDPTATDQVHHSNPSPHL